MPCARRNWIASSEAWRRTASQGVPSANWSEMAPIRPVWMLMESVIADRIGPDQYEVCELIGIGRMWRLWLPRQSQAIIGHAAQGEVISPRLVEHTSEIQSPCKLVSHLLLEKHKFDDVSAKAAKHAWQR